MKAPLLGFLAVVSCMCASNRVVADPWSTQPLLGIEGAYSSNPVLVPTESKSATNAAVSVDMPVNYDNDSLHFAFVPRVRYGNESTYSSVASNYFHFDTSAQYADDLGALTLAQSFYRDSSLLYAGGLENGTGVRRDTVTSDINWQHALTERSQIQGDLNTTRVLFDEGATQHGLVDYRYSSFSPSYAYELNERDTLRVLGAVSRYYSLNDLTSSDSDSVQLGYVHRLSELWTLSANAGYTKSTDASELLFFGYYLGTSKESQSSPTYTLTLGRQSEQLGITLTASRAFAPTGYQFLEREDLLAVTAKYVASERWEYNVAANWESLTGPPSPDGAATGHYYSVSVSTTWHWTEQWQCTVSASKVEQSAAQSAANATSTGIVVQLARRFYRTNN